MNMIFMTFLKIIFTLLICVPIVCLMIYLLVRLIDEVLKQKPKSERRKNQQSRRTG